MHAAPACLALALAAAPAAAQDMEVIRFCGLGGFDNALCDTEVLAGELGLLSAGSVRVFHDLGMESFAMLTALRYAASAIYFNAEDEACVAEEERTAALEIWSIWVQKPERMPAEASALYDIYDGIMNGVADMEVSC